MAELMLGASSFLQELLYISRDIVWKDEKYARELDSLLSADDARNIELYLAAHRGELNLVSIPEFDLDVLIAGGVQLEDLIKCQYDKNKIPIGCRKRCIELQTEKIKKDYEEQNNYYRMLNGMPDVEDNEYFYNTLYPDISAPDIPIHELPVAAAYTLETLGYYEDLYKKNPSKKYLKFLGKRRIEPYIARESERFALLYMESSEFTRINVDFRDTYNISRFAMVHSMYAETRSHENPYYENFMAMMVLFMTINQMLSKYLDADLDRDFYDYESIKYVYDTYGVPFYASIPLEYHVKIIKNINILMSYKGSTNVFYKLFDIFNFGTMDIFSYYIMKTHKFEDGKPVFKYNPDGTENVKEMYDIKFGQVMLYNNPALELTNEENIIDYDTMIKNDPYWIHDEELLEKVYSMDYNYIETKYVGVRTVFDLMNVAHESALFFKLMFDKRTTVSSIEVFYNPLLINIDLYTIIIYTCALICKRYGYEGQLGGITQTAKVLGYNFKADLDKVRQFIMSNPDICEDTELLGLLVGMDVNSLASINMVFARIEALRDLLVKRKFYATSKEEFDAYSEVYNTLLVSEYMESSFKKKNGIQANTFADMLSDLNESLYIRYEEMQVSDASSEAIDMEIETILNLLRQTVSGLDYIDMCASSASSSLISHLFKLMDFFKSAKAELTGFTIAYDLGARGEAVVKLFSNFIPITKYNYVVPQFDMIDVFTDELHLVQEQFWHRWKFYLKDWWKWEHEHVHIDVPMPIIFEFILRVSEIYKYKSVAHIHDIIQKVSHEYFIKERLEFMESVSLLYEKIHYDVIETLINDSFEYFTSMIHQCADIAHYFYKSEFKFNDKFWHQLFRKLYKEPFIMESSIEQFNDDTVRIQKSSFGLSDRLVLVYEQIITELEYLEPIPDNN